MSETLWQGLASKNSVQFSTVQNIVLTTVVWVLIRPRLQILALPFLRYVILNKLFEFSKPENSNDNNNFYWEFTLFWALY